jgi:hypothetical protein
MGLLGFVCGGGKIYPARKDEMKRMVSELDHAGI